MFPLQNGLNEFVKKIKNLSHLAIIDTKTLPSMILLYILMSTHNISFSWVKGGDNMA